MAKPGSKPIDELVALAINGDGPAFTRLWDTYILSLKIYLKGWLKNMDDFYIDDICSRSFEKAFRQIKTFNPSKGQFLTWLKSIAHNTALDIIQEETRSIRKCISLDGGNSQTSAVESLADELDTPLESIIKNEDKVKLQEGIDGLPELYRTIAVMRLLDGMQYKEIAEELDMELNTVRTRIRRAKAMIDKMQQEDDN